jgi:hypothetical protein
MDQHPALLGTSSLSMRAGGRALPPLARAAFTIGIASGVF